uniref:B30.2/SPRY domain-containing protein n=1 Tax=Acrobeloides nanus TaxID=290746 RepID=A0A914CN74_9BILA
VIGQLTQSNIEITTKLKKLQDKCNLLEKEKIQLLTKITELEDKLKSKEDECREDSIKLKEQNKMMDMFKELLNNQKTHECDLRSGKPEEKHAVKEENNSSQKSPKSTSYSYSGAGLVESRTKVSSASTVVEKKTEVFIESFYKLYRHIDFKKESFPHCWNILDACPLLSLSEQNLRVRYNGQGIDDDDAAMIRAIRPIPKSSGVYYFEIRVASRGADGAIGIGICGKSSSLNSMPGWETDTIGYNGEDGMVYCDGEYLKYKQKTFTTGDVVGCGVDFCKKEIFFTKNGKNLGVADVNIPIIDIYPTIGFNSAGAIMETNFGQKSFVYDVSKDIENALSNPPTLTKNPPTLTKNPPILTKNLPTTKKTQQLFSNTHLWRKDGTVVDAEKHLQNKVIGLYFSGYWCPPSRDFTPILRDFYNQIAYTNNFEIVFVSSDRTDYEMQYYLNELHGNWLYIPFGNLAIEVLSNSYGVKSIPTLLIIKPSGETIAYNGRDQVLSIPPLMALEMWKAYL